MEKTPTKTASAGPQAWIQNVPTIGQPASAPMQSVEQTRIVTSPTGPWSWPWKREPILQGGDLELTEATRKGSSNTNSNNKKHHNQTTVTSNQPTYLPTKQTNQTGPNQQTKQTRQTNKPTNQTHQTNQTNQQTNKPNTPNKPN